MAIDALVGQGGLSPELLIKSLQVILNELTSVAGESHCLLACIVGAGVDEKVIVPLLKDSRLSAKVLSCPLETLLNTNFSFHSYSLFV